MKYMLQGLKKNLLVTYLWTCGTCFLD